MSSVLGLLLRIYSCLFELALALFLIALGTVAWASGPNDLNLGMLPWEGAALRRATLILGILGLTCVLLAGSRLRWIFPLWCLFVLGAMIRGFFLSSYRFAGTDQFQIALVLTTGAMVAFLGSLGLWRSRSTRR